MSTKLIAAGILVIAVSAFLFLNTNPMTNNRYQGSTVPAEDTDQVFTSRLKEMPTDSLTTSTEKLTELQKEVILEGNTEDTREVATGDTITVNYIGWTASDGVIFDQSFNRGDDGLTFTVGSGVIDGWSEGVVGMKVGEVVLLKIPAELGYGAAGNGSIPADADLYFYVELLAFEE